MLSVIAYSDGALLQQSIALLHGSPITTCSVSILDQFQKLVVACTP